MTWYELWLFLHVSAAITWVGGAAVVQIFGVLTKRAADPAKSAFFARNVSWTVMHVFLPASFVVIVSGIGLMTTGNWGWDQPFVLFGLVFWAATSIVAFGYLGRAQGRAAAQLAADGPTPQLMLRFRNLLWASRALLGILVAIVFMMTVKPGT